MVVTSLITYRPDSPHSAHHYLHSQLLSHVNSYFTADDNPHSFVVDETFGIAMDSSFIVCFGMKMDSLMMLDKVYFSLLFGPVSTRLWL